MKVKVHLKVNGLPYELEVEPRRTLLELIREDLELTGTKEGCGLGECGTCTVLLDGKPVKSCITLAVQANGRDVTTIEGVERPDGTLHPVQQAFIDHGAIQCGFCTPGMVLSAKAFLEENPKPTELQVRQAIAGNLCRCTGYQKIVEAILAVAGQGASTDKAVDASFAPRGATLKGERDETV
jgi:aerobic carbon-monoxide dehydrogenase small subunit